MTIIDTTDGRDGDMRPIRREISETTRLAEGFGRAITKAFTSSIVQGKDLGDVLRSLALQLSSMTISAALKPLEQGFGKLLEQLFKGITGATTGTPANLLSQAMAQNTEPFASGGVIATPTYFPHGPSLGVAGERGAEAILPLARGADGRLGVRAATEGRPVSVTVNVSAPDAASFRRSEAYLSGVIARAVARGERSL